MNRVDMALQAGRCVFALGKRALSEPEILVELRRRVALKAVTLTGAAPEGIEPVSLGALASILEQDGGVLVLVDPELPSDAPGVSALGALVEVARFKPRLVVVAKAFNPFALPPALRMLKMEQDKSRSRDFFAALPAPPVPVQAAPAASAPAPAPAARLNTFAALRPTAAPVEDGSRKGKGERAPRCAVVGRDAETETFREMLAQGGPVIVEGAPGVGKRWFIEHALEGFPCRRVPDIHLGFGTETDSLYARFAAWFAAAGDRSLSDAWNHPDRRPPPEAMAAMVVECLKNPALAEGVMVIHGLDERMREDGSFHRNGRLESLLQALLLGTYAPRLIFPLVSRPVFYREGLGANLRVLALDGLEGKYLHEIFDAYRVEGFPRDAMGPLHQLIHGHPLMTRIVAAACRESEDPAKLLTERKSLKMEQIRDMEIPLRHLRRRLEKLAPDLRKALVLAGHFRAPVPVEMLQGLGVDRNTRFALLGQGLLDMDPRDNGRSVYVHPLVRELIPRREFQDIEILERIADLFAEAARQADGLERLAMIQEANRYYMAARRPQRLIRAGHFDQDPILESVRGLIRCDRPFISMAEERLGRVLAADPGNTEAWLLRAETAALANAQPEAIEKIYEEGITRAPTLEIFHHAATWHQSRGKSGDLEAAIAVLRRGADAFPENGRIRRRLAGCLVDKGEFDAAILLLRETMDLEPMMPDTYGFLGGILIGRGPSSWDEAAQLIEEALRLAPEDPVHLWRIGRLERLRGLIDRENREACWTRAAGHFEAALRNRRRAGDAMREYTVLLLDRGSPEDMDKIGWLLKQLEQLKDGPDVQVEQARLLTRKGQAGEAEEVLKRIVKRDPKHHAARAALGEACFARGQVFQAAKAYQLAQQDAPSNAVERIAYQVVIDQLTSLIESGEALTIERAASEEEKARALALEPVASDLSRRPLVRERPPRKPRTARPRREPKADGSAPDETDESVSPEGAPSEEPVPEESVPEESVPEEPDVVEPGEPS